MIWRLEYENAHGDVARLDIQRGAATPVEIIEGTENPFLLSYELEDKSKKGFIMSSFADISIYETATFNIDDLKTLDETALSVKWYINSVLEWTGFVVPDFFSRTIGEPAIVNLAASDRLSSLEDATLDGLSEYIKLKDLAIACLAKTGLSLPLISTVDFKADNVTNVMDVFAMSERLEDGKGKKISCFDVLRSILVLTNSTIRQRKGQWRIYNKIQHEALTPSLNFDEVYQGATRTIQPVLASVGAFQEFGGIREFPLNNSFKNNDSNWAKGGSPLFVTSFDNRDFSFATATSPAVFGQATNQNQLINRNVFNSGATSLSGTPYLKSVDIKVPLEDTGTSRTDSVQMTIEINSKSVHQSIAHFAVVRFYDGVVDAYLANNLDWEPFFSTIDINYIQANIRGQGYGVEDITTIETGVRVGRGKDPSKYKIAVYILGVTRAGSPTNRMAAIRSVKVIFPESLDFGKGILYRTDQLGNFSKKSDPDTTIFGDFITMGLNGYFYPYRDNDKSALKTVVGSTYSSTTEWTTATDPAAGELPILQHVTRQISRMFGVAHNVISAVIDAKTFDPLAIVTNCAGEKYVIVYSVFDFLRSTVEVELQQIAYGSLQRRDFIFSYFGGGDGDGISSIGSVSGGGSSGGSGGGGIPQTLDLLADELFISGGNSVDLGVYARKTWVETAATAYNAARLGGLAANLYPRKSENAIVTGAWAFRGNPVFSNIDEGAGESMVRFNKAGNINGLLRKSGIFLDIGNNGYKLYSESSNAYGSNPSFIIETHTGLRRFLIDISGKVGIGTTEPTERLHVVGNGLFTGNLTAQKGAFSSLDVTGNGLFTGNVTAQGNLDVTGISTFRDRIGTNAFVSGFTGDGTWRLQTGDETHLTVDRLTVRGRMDVYELVINQIRATNGSLWVTDAMKTIGATRLGPISFRFAFDNDNGNRGCTFVVGDIVKAQRFTGRGVVVFVGYVYGVAADHFTLITAGYISDYTGDLETLAGLEFVRIGHISDSNRQGSLYLTSSDSGAPYMDVLDGVNSASLAGKTKVRLGKLDGISDSELGSLTGYGLYAENAYLKGKIIAKSGVIGGWDITTDRIRKLFNIGGYFDLKATTQPRIEISIDGTIDNRLLLFYNSPSHWGLQGTVDGVTTFRLGDSNFIAGISFNDSRLFTSRWWIDKDGSFSFGNGKITGTAAGNVTIDGSLVTQHITAQSIEGLDLNFTQGTIGGFTIGSDYLFSTDIELRKNNITINDAGKLIFKQKYNYYSRGNPSIDFYASDTNTMVGALESSARGVILQGYNKFGQNVKSPAMVEILHDQLILGGKLRIGQLEVVHYVENQYDTSLPLPSNWYTDKANVAITRNVIVLYKNFNFANVTDTIKEGSMVTFMAALGHGTKRVQNFNIHNHTLNIKEGRFWTFIFSNGNWYEHSHD